MQTITAEMKPQQLRRELQEGRNDDLLEDWAERRRQRARSPIERLSDEELEATIRSEVRLPKGAITDCQLEAIVRGEL